MMCMAAWSHLFCACIRTPTSPPAGMLAHRMELSSPGQPRGGTSTERRLDRSPDPHPPPSTVPGGTVPANKKRHQGIGWLRCEICLGVSAFCSLLEPRQPDLSVGLNADAEQVTQQEHVLRLRVHPCVSYVRARESMCVSVHMRARARCVSRCVPFDRDPLWPTSPNA